MNKGKEKLQKHLGKIIRSSKKGVEKEDNKATVSVEEGGKDAVAAKDGDGGNDNKDVKAIDSPNPPNEEQTTADKGIGNASSDAERADDMTQKIDESFLGEVSGRNSVRGRQNPSHTKGHTRELTQTVDENFLAEVRSPSATSVHQEKPHPISGPEAESSRPAGHVHFAEDSLGQQQAEEQHQSSSQSDNQSGKAEHGWKHEGKFWHDVVRLFFIYFFY